LPVSSDVPTADAADAALVARMSNGDRAALAELYERHAARMLALALSILRDREEAEDLLHDVFLEAWRRSADYSVERGSVRAWLVTRTRSRALDRIKSTRRRRDVPDEGDPVVVTLPFAMDDHQLLRQTLKHMPEPQKQVLLLGYFEGLSAAEIAERLGIPVGTVKSRTRAALASLRELLGAVAHE